MHTYETAVFGGGCFWCTEAVFDSLRGIISATPGYSGGSVKNPTYEQVSAGDTAHAEVTKVEFDPNEITYRDLLTIFFATHDPTTLNRQGNDIGTQYRSVIFYMNDEQKWQAETYIKEVAPSFTDPIVTSLQPFEAFYPAEDYHRKYYENHKDFPYCQAVIDPKMEKLQQHFASFLKSHTKQ